MVVLLYGIDLAYCLRMRRMLDWLCCQHPHFIHFINVLHLLTQNACYFTELILLELSQICFRFSGVVLNVSTKETASMSIVR